jgi:hypothetical protein
MSLFDLFKYFDPITISFIIEVVIFSSKIAPSADVIDFGVPVKINIRYENKNISYENNK